MSEAEKPVVKKTSGCVIILLVLLSVVSIGFSLFYLLYWYIPGNDREARIYLENGKAWYYEGFSLPAGDNGWNDYCQAKNKIDLTMVPTPTPGVYINVFNEWVYNGVPKKDKEQVKIIVYKNQEAIKLAKQGGKKKIAIPSELPTVQFGLSSSSSSSYNNSEICIIVADFLTLCARQKMDEDKYKDAAEIEMAILGLCKGPEPFGWGQYTRWGIFSRVSQDLVKIIASAKDGDPVFKYLITELNVLKPELPDLTKSLEMNLFYYHDLADASHKRMQTYGGPFYFRLIPMGLIIKREIKILDVTYTEIMKLTKLKGYDALQTVKKMERNKKSLYFSGFYTTEIMTRFQGNYSRLTQINGLIIAAAMRQYKTDKGYYPDKPEDLVPGYLAFIPEDYMSPGGKFIYRKKGPSEVILYSYGTNLTDEGGSSSFMQSSGHPDDFVFLDVKPGKKDR